MMVFLCMVWVKLVIFLGVLLCICRVVSVVVICMLFMFFDMILCMKVVVLF